MRKLLWIFTLILSLVAAAEEPADPNAPDASIDLSWLHANPGISEGHSLAPVIGYDPTYKFVVGGAYFYERPHLSFGADFNLNFKQVYQFHLRATHRFDPRWEYKVVTGITKGFDPYYGEGGQTVAADLRNLWGSKSTTRIQLSHRITPLFLMGFFLDGRTHTEEPTEGQIFRREFPNEAGVGFGLNSEIDTRKNKKDPKEGFVFNTDLTFVPRGFNTLKNWGDFAQLESSFIVYSEILHDTFPGLVAAFRLKGGYSWGEPSYMYKFRLGGANMMQGYLENRFRGRKYYLQQTEIRFPVYKLVSGAALLGFGDATNGNFTQPKMAYGLGLRLGLPPDNVNKIRLDFGFGHDESGIFAEFGHTF